MHKIQAVRHIRKHIFIQFGIIDLINSQVDNSDGIPNHRLWMIAEFLCHHQKWKMFVLLIVEKLYRVLIEQQSQGLDERHVNVHQFLIVKVKIEFNELVQKWMAQNIISLRLLTNILQKYARGLNQLDIYISIIEI